MNLIRRIFRYSRMHPIKDNASYGCVRVMRGSLDDFLSEKRKAQEKHYSYSQSSGNPH